MNINAIKFNQTVQAAIAKAPQMAKQIEAAAENLLSNPYVADVDGGLLILSDSGNTYFAKSRGNSCGCKAHQFKQTCWHRLADALYRHYQRGH